MLNAIKVAKEKGMKVIAMTGKDGGQMAGLADVETEYLISVTQTASKKFTLK